MCKTFYALHIGNEIGSAASTVVVAVVAVVAAVTAAGIAVIAVASAAEPENKQDNDDPAAAVVAKVKTTVHKNTLLQKYNVF